MNPKDLFPALTRRQAEILDLRQQGHNHQEIADKLGIKIGTVQNITTTTTRKLRVMKTTVENWEE
jgi:DNA-binding NarL/FixJ family response regulator